MRLLIFINPNPQQEVVYYGFEMNARGVLYDYVNYNSRAVQTLRCHRREDRDVPPRVAERSHRHR